MKIIHSIAMLAITSSLLLANQNNANLKHIVKIGNSSSKLLLKTLGSNMKKNMKTGGAIKALNFCSEKAYTLTEKVNNTLAKNVSIKRVSLKYRNVANKPTKDEEAILKSLEDLQKNSVILPKHVVQKIDKDTYKFYKPLIINKKVCLKCHGNIQNEKLKKEIATKYPEDKAINYKMGDLRGVVVVTIKEDTKK